MHPLSSAATPDASTPAWRRSDTALLLGLLLLGLAVRLWAGWNSTYIVHPDETADYLEQGHRLLHGHGWLTWTYRNGVRPLAYPAFLAGVIWIGEQLGGAQAGPNAVAVAMSVLSLIVILAAFLWGRQAEGRLGAILAGFAAATWFELIYFAPRGLSEVIATVFLVGGALLLTLLPLPRTGARPVLAGMALAIAFYLRIQIAPAIAVLALWWLCAAGARAFWRAALAGAAIVLLFGLIDAWTYQYPFQSVILNFYANAIARVSAEYGSMPVHFLLGLEFAYLNGALALLVGLLALGATRAPVLLAVAAAIILSHSAFFWKEYRFFYPAMPFLVALSAIGSARALRLLGQRALLPACALAGVGIALWAVTSYALALQGPFRREWTRSSGMIAAARQVARMDEVCGIGLYRYPISLNPGYVRLGHHVPVIFVQDPARFAASAAGFNVMLAPDDALPPDPRFSVQACHRNGFLEASQNRRLPHVCVLTRPGPCNAGVPSDPGEHEPPGW